MSYWLIGAADLGNWSFQLQQGPNRFGRSRQHTSSVIAHKTVSRLHAEIVVELDRLEIRDLQSRCGTFVNGLRVASQVLHPGDEIALGDAHLMLCVNGTAPTRFSGQTSLQDIDLTWSELAPASQSSGQSRFLAALAGLAEFLLQDASPEDACERCFELVWPLFRFRRACLLVMDEAGEPEVRCAYPRNLRSRELQVSRSLVETVVREARSLLVKDDAQDSRLLQSESLRGKIRSALVVPLRIGGRVVGALYMDQDDPRRAFHKRHVWRLELLGNLVAAKLMNARNLNEMRSAAFIQRAFLCEPQHPAGYDLSVRLEPCQFVGGDLYETLRLPDGRYLYALGDVSGHGVGAALVMANALATLRALAPSARTPLELAERFRELIAPRLASCDFITLFLGFLDPGRHQLDYVSAGHDPPLLLVPDQPLQWLNSTGPPIGLEIGIPLEAAVAGMPPGSVCGIWSDGIPEALRFEPHQPHEPFTRERVVECFETHRDASAAQIGAAVFREVDAWLHGAHALDDRTLLVLRNRARPRSPTPPTSPP